MKKAFPLVLFIAIAGISCSKKTTTNTENQKTDASFTNTRWKLVKLPGIELLPLKKDAFIQFEPKKNQAFGSGGCNNMQGTFTLKGKSLKIGPMANTMMACTPEIMRVEDGFHKVLTEVDNFFISGDKLQLKKGGTVLAELEALYLK
jgi:copper homeostasis protein (lipoprotein)